jgi:hypothetical protein
MLQLVHETATTKHLRSGWIGLIRFVGKIESSERAVNGLKFCQCADAFGGGRTGRYSNGGEGEGLGRL